MSKTQRAAIGRAHWLAMDPTGYWAKLRYDVLAWARKAVRQRNAEGVAVRMAGGADLRWEDYPEWLALVEDTRGVVRWFDYTKHIDRVDAFLAGDMPEGYHLTLSWGGGSAGDWIAGPDRVLLAGGTVAIIHAEADEILAAGSWRGHPVVRGDANDRRYRDPPGSVAILSPKGAALRVVPSPLGFVMTEAGA